MRYSNLIKALEAEFKCEYCPHNTDDSACQGDCGCFIAQAVTAIEEQEQEINILGNALKDIQNGGRWIPVEERLPRPFEGVLLVHSGDVYFGYHDKNHGWEVSGEIDVSPVTHWMPLPEPPKGA